MNIKNVTELGLKELFSLRSDPVLIFLIIYNSHKNPNPWAHI